MAFLPGYAHRSADPRDGEPAAARSSKRFSRAANMSAVISIDHADAFWGTGAEVTSTGKEATVKKFVLHGIAITVAAIVAGGAGISNDALARDGGGGGHFGGAMSGGHLGGIGGGHFGGEAEHRRYGHYRGRGAPYQYYGDYDACLQQGSAEGLGGSDLDAYTSECANEN